MTYDISAMFNATAVSLRFPANLRDRIHRYVRQHQGGAVIVEQAPFRRQLDVWVAAIGIACAKGLKPRKGSSTSWGERFVDTRSVQLDPQVAELLVAIAAADWGIEDERLGDPKEVMELANAYAASGLPLLLQWLEDPSLRQTNVDKVLSEMKDLRTEALASEGMIPDLAKDAGSV